MQKELIKGEEGNALLEDFLRTGGLELRNRLILFYLPIVRSAAVHLRGMAGSITEEEDLIGQGVLALMECLDRYAPDRGARFETFAYTRVRGAMIDYIRSQDWVPHRARSFQKQVEEACSLLAQEKLREPDVEEIAGYLDMPAKKVEDHLAYMNRAAVLSFETVLQDITGTAGDSAGPEESLYYKEFQEILAKAVNALGEKERLVVTLYYFEELKYSEIAQVMDVGRSRVCQIHTGAMKKLKDSLEEYMKG